MLASFRHLVSVDLPLVIKLINVGFLALSVQLVQLLERFLVLPLSLGRFLFHFFNFTISAGQILGLLLLVSFVVSLLLSHLLLAPQELLLKICSVVF